MRPMQELSNILFITASRIGDAVLSSGLLSYMAQNYPNAKVTIACGPLAVSLFEGFDNVDAIIPLKKRKYNGHWIDLWCKTVGKRWDLVVDLRNSAVSRLVFANKRRIFGKYVDKTAHKVLQNAQVMGLRDHPPAPVLHFTPDQIQKVQNIIGPKTSQGLIGIGPAANWIGKTWPVERFIEIVQRLIVDGGAFEGSQVAVFGAPGEEEVCYQLYESLPDGQRIDAIAKGSPGEAAAMLSLCDFYLGNDSGLMHAAAACGVPTFGLFGPSYPHLYAPWGAHTAYVRTPETFDELIDYPGYTPQTAPCLMGSLSVEKVWEALDMFLKEQAKKKAA